MQYSVRRENDELCEVYDGKEVMCECKGGLRAYLNAHVIVLSLNTMNLLTTGLATGRIVEKDDAPEPT